MPRSVPWVAIKLSSRALCLEAATSDNMVCVLLQPDNNQIKNLKIAGIGSQEIYSPRVVNRILRLPTWASRYVLNL